jgi:hypothetical protein
LFHQLLDVFFPFAVAFSKMDPFFFCCHAVPLPDGNAFGKSLGDLTSTKNSLLGNGRKCSASLPRFVMAPCLPRC